MHDVSAFTLPAFQWEPVYNISNPDALAGFPDKLVSPTDGGATRIATSSASVVALAPHSPGLQMLEEYGEPGSVLGARFTLPFGIVASARLETPQQPAVHDLPQFTSTTPAFTASGMSGGLQVTLTAAEPSPLQPAGAPRALPGLAIQTNNAGGWNVLKSGQHRRHLQRHVRGHDADGAGASASTSPATARPRSATGAAPIQSGHRRHAGEVRSHGRPHLARGRAGPLAGSIPGARSSSASSRWSAPAAAACSAATAAGRPRATATTTSPGCIVHPGVVPRLTNIRRIRDTTNVYERVYARRRS